MTVNMIFPSSVASWALTKNGTKRNQQSRVHFMDLPLACVGEKPSGKEGRCLPARPNRPRPRSGWHVDIACFCPTPGQKRIQLLTTAFEDEDDDEDEDEYEAPYGKTSPFF